jgi:hypothetical protein
LRMFQPGVYRRAIPQPYDASINMLTPAILHARSMPLSLRFAYHVTAFSS